MLVIKTGEFLHEVHLSVEQSSVAFYNNKHWMAKMFHKDVCASAIYYITTAPANFNSAFLGGCYEQFKTQKVWAICQTLHNSWHLMPEIVFE